MWTKINVLNTFMLFFAPFGFFHKRKERHNKSAMNEASFGHSANKKTQHFMKRAKKCLKTPRIN